jgi:hypothetical protein
MKIVSYKEAYAFYPLPMIRVTHDRILFGFYAIDFVWFSSGVSITFGHLE